LTFVRPEKSRIMEARRRWVVHPQHLHRWTAAGLSLESDFRPALELVCVELIRTTRNRDPAREGACAAEQRRDRGILRRK
jgi:hypothetical protein